MQTFIGSFIQVNRGEQEQQHCPLLLFTDIAPASLLHTSNLSPLLKIHEGAKESVILPLYISAHLLCHIYVLLEKLLTFLDIFLYVFGIKQVSFLMNYEFQCLALACDV